MTNRIYEELKKRIEASGFEPITIEMKCNGDKITITPCWSGMGAPRSWSEIEYFLVDSTVLNLYGSESLERIVPQIANYEELLKENDDEIEKLKAYIRKYGKNSDWDWVSDWHKDLFGHRPHVSTKQQIEWASSNSKMSARYFR